MNIHKYPTGNGGWKQLPPFLIIATKKENDYE